MVLVEQIKLVEQERLDDFCDLL